MTTSFQQFASENVKVDVVLSKCLEPELEDAPSEGQDIAYDSS